MNTKVPVHQSPRGGLNHVKMHISNEAEESLQEWGQIINI